MESHKQLLISKLEILGTFADKYKSYQNANIDLHRILYFLSQFESARQVEIVIRLLSRLEYVDPDRMTYLLKNAYNKIPAQLRANALITTIGGVQDSSALICYRLLKTLFKNEDQALSGIINSTEIGSQIMTRKPSAIIFFDDNITSGTQLQQFIEELIDGRSQPELISRPLTTAQVEILRQIPLRFCYAYQLSRESNGIVENIRTKYGLDIEIVCSKIDDNNYVDFQCDTMQSEEEAIYTQEFIRSIATNLYDDKHWDKDKLYHRLLGYGNLGKLTVFYYNVPKSLLPIFWKSGVYKRRDWIPLFPEYQEKKKLESEQIELDPRIMEWADEIIGSSKDKRAPQLTFGFFIDGEFNSDIILTIPSKQSIERIVTQALTITEFTPDPNDSANIRQATFPVGVTKETYELYLERVADYNDSVKRFRQELETYIYQYASSRTVALRIRNTGDKSATNCRLRVFYNSSLVILDNKYSLVTPKFEEERPVLRDHYEGRVVMAQTTLPAIDLPGLSKSQKRPKYKPNTNYESTYNFEDVGHNGKKNIDIPLTRIDTTQSTFDLDCEVNYDEDGGTHEGKLSIEYHYSDKLEPMEEEELREIVKSFNKDNRSSFGYGLPWR